MATYDHELNAHEDELIEKLKKNPVLTSIGERSNSEFEALLKQRRFLSAIAFTSFYDSAIDGLSDAEAKEVARWVLREEYPTGRQSHREDLLEDLMKTGLTKASILSTQPSPQTEATIKRLWGLVAYKEPNYDIKAVVALRLAGEMLVSVEYGFILPELGRRYDLKAAESKFYWPHFMEDQKVKHVGEKGKTHADVFSTVLARLVNTDEKLGIAKRAMDASYNVRASFYEQFKKG